MKRLLESAREHGASAVFCMRYHPKRDRPGRLLAVTRNWPSVTVSAPLPTTERFVAARSVTSRQPWMDRSGKSSCPRSWVNDEPSQHHGRPDDHSEPGEALAAIWTFP